MTGKARRVVCEFCGHEVAVRQDGLLYRHRTYKALTYGRLYKVGEVCPGSNSRVLGDIKQGG